MTFFEGVFLNAASSPRISPPKRPVLFRADCVHYDLRNYDSHEQFPGIDNNAFMFIQK